MDILDGMPAACRESSCSTTFARCVARVGNLVIPRRFHVVSLENLDSCQNLGSESNRRGIFQIVSVGQSNGISSWVKVKDSVGVTSVTQLCRLVDVETSSHHSCDPDCG